jgi:hypothetical protein
MFWVSLYATLPVAAPCKNTIRIATGDDVIKALVLLMKQGLITMVCLANTLAVNNSSVSKVYIFS